MKSKFTKKYKTQGKADIHHTDSLDSPSITKRAKKDMNKNIQESSEVSNRNPKVSDIDYFRKISRSPFTIFGFCHIGEDNMDVIMPFFITV